MKQKRTFIIIGAIGLVIFVAFWLVVLALVVKTLRGLSTDEVEVPVGQATLCDEDAAGLCIVNFGTNSLNRMIINFRLPGEEYAAFYVKARNRDTISVYTCEADETDLTIVRCTGVRTPLGETIDLEIYTTDGDQLIAQGTFLVSAVAIPTPISLPSEAPTEEPAVTEEPFATEEPFVTEEPTLPPEGESTPEFPSSGQ
jgi:hypothetical protein